MIVPNIWESHSKFHASSHHQMFSEAFSGFQLPHSSHIPGRTGGITQGSAHRMQGQQQEAQQMAGSERQSKCPEDHSFNCLRGDREKQGLEEPLSATKKLAISHHHGDLFGDINRDNTHFHGDIGM